MKKFRVIILLVAIHLLASCEYDDLSWIFVNNSDEDILIARNNSSFYIDSIIPCYLSDVYSGRLYTHFYEDACILAHSRKKMDRIENRSMIDKYYQTDTLYIVIFNRKDYDSLSTEDFRKLYPIQYEFKITLQYMIDREWTLVYPPEE